MPASISFEQPQAIAVPTANPPFLVIVSDKFAGFCEKPEILNYSALIDQIQSGTLSTRRLILGQGVSARQLETLRESLARKRLLDSISIQEKVSAKADPQRVHKCRSENVLITQPVMKTETQFSASLVIDENCDEMRDHVTGKHIPGTLLIEAARQMFMASSEILNRHEGFDTGFSYMLQKIQIEFSGFLFPLDVNLHLDFINVKWAPRKTSGSASGRISFIQFNRPVCEAVCSGAGFPGPTVDALEKRQCLKIYNYLTKQ